ncbi:MAG: tetratricopeptide repeat protein [Deltaproteobacteria bacterium]|nr:tetratricopeptide repeat protein [Deltaproteobacteria bacterium]
MATRGSETPGPSPVPVEDSGPVESRTRQIDRSPTETGSSTVGHRQRGKQRSIIEACQSELDVGPEPARAARLHYNIARELENTGARLDQALEHYQKALEHNSDSMPAIRGARRVCLAAGDYQSALQFFDAELKLTRDPRAKAMLHYAKGRCLEDSLGDFDEARKAFKKALSLDGNNAAVLKGLERIETGAGRPNELAEVLRKLANSVPEDPRHRATLQTERAQLIERSGQAGVATELYAAALRLDADHPGPPVALERLYHNKKDWTHVAELFTRHANRTSDALFASLNLRRAARLQAEHLGSDADAIAALATAMNLSPKDALVLDELGPMYQSGELIVSLAEVLRQQILITSDLGERAALLHSLGHIYELLAHDQEASACYENSLEIDPSHSASIKALDRIYTRYDNWTALLRVYIAEAGYTEDPERGAAAHIRAATIYEERQRKPKAAIEHFARALTRVPMQPVAFKALIRLYRQAGQFRELVELYDRGAQLADEPNQVVALLFQAAQVWEDALGDPGRAASAYQRIIEREPANMAAIQGLQRVTERAGRYRELVSALELELNLASEDRRRIALHHRTGTVLADNLEDPDAAVLQFRKILEIDPTHPPTLASLGRLYRASGRWEELLDVYQRELIREAQGRRSAVLLHKMGELCERCLGDDQGAVDHYRKALEHDPGFRPALRSLAQQLRNHKNWSALIDALKLEAESAPDDHLRSIGWYRIGEVYEYHLFDSDNAARAYEIAVSTSPGHRPSLAALARLRYDRAEWHALLGELTTEVELTSDESRKIALVMHRGAIFRDELEDYPSAIACYEAVLHDKVGRLPALMALEKLYPLVGDYDKLAATYQAIADQTRDRNAELASLREMARVMETRGVGTREQLLGVFDRILELVPGDLHTLERMEDLARSTKDAALGERIYRQLIELTEDPALRSHYLTELAAAMEAQQDYRAIEFYRQAITGNREQMAAIRGLARLAEATGDAIGVADAAKLEAEQTSDSRTAALLFHRSATLRITTDLESGIADLRRALALAPEYAEAAKALTVALTGADRTAELVEDLGAAARSCKDDDRAAELWLQVAGLHADELDQHAAGIGALQRGLTTLPAHVPSLVKLAELHRHEGQWRDAVRALERVLEASKERELFCTTNLQLAELWEQHLDDFEKAKKSVKAVLDRYPTHPDALSMHANFLAREGKLEQAVTVIRQLIAERRDPSERAAALLRLAKLETERKDDRASEEALKEAVILEGPRGPAAEVYSERADKQGSWIGYAAALSAYLQAVKAGTTPRPSPADLVHAFATLAKTYDQGMKLPNKAIEVLIDGLRDVDGDPSIYLDLATRLRKAGRFREAKQRTQELLATDPGNAEAWSLLAKLFSDQGQRVEARYAHHPLALLEVEGMQVPRPRSKTLSNPISLDLVHALSPERATTNPAAALLAASADAAGKLFPPALERYGLSRRDRLGSRSGHPLREAADRIAEIFTVDEFDFYVHDRRAPLLSIELTEPAAIVLSSSAGRLSGSQQAFLLSYAMASLAARFHPALRLSARELEQFLAAAARAVTETMSSPLASRAQLYEQAQVIRKSVSRRWRRAHEVAGGEYARLRLNVAHWQQSLLHTAIRSALIVCDDLKSGIKVLRRMHNMPDMAGRELVESSRTVAELMRFWTSDDAFRARRQCGLISPPTPPPGTPSPSSTG